MRNLLVKVPILLLTYLLLTGCESMVQRAAHPLVFPTTTPTAPGTLTPKAGATLVTYS